MRKLGIVALCLLMCGCARISDVIDMEDTSKSDTQEEKKDTTKKTLVCTNDNEEEITFEAKGDELQKMTQIFYMSFEDLGISSDMDTSQMEQIINDSLTKKYENLDGVDVSGTLEESRVKITVTIDYNQADMDRLIEEGLLQKGEKQNQYISFKETKKDYKENGYACSLE